MRSLERSKRLTWLTIRRKETSLKCGLVWAKSDLYCLCRCLRKRRNWCANDCGTFGPREECNVSAALYFFSEDELKFSMTSFFLLPQEIGEQSHFLSTPGSNSSATHSRERNGRHDEHAGKKGAGSIRCAATSFCKSRGRGHHEREGKGCAKHWL